MAQKPINLPWNQHESYWIAAVAREEGEPCPAGMKAAADGTHYLSRSSKRWAQRWQELHSQMAPEAFDFAVIGGEAEPSAEQVAFAKKPFAAIQEIAESAWLGEALLEGRVMCYLQPIVSQQGKALGYESFVRARRADQSIASGGEVMAAAKALGIEYAIDRHLHVQAVETFMHSGMSGFLFINFMPGFIQRPEVYLEGLSEAVRQCGMSPKHIVLDFTQSESPHDLAHLKRVTDYCRERGFSLALDDLTTPANADRLIPEIRPDFIKLDMQLTRRLKRDSDRALVQSLIAIAHKCTASVIAEGVEDAEQHQTLLTLGADFFQGYFFGAPEAAEVALRQANG